MAVSKEAIAMASGEHLWAGPACCNNELLRNRFGHAPFSDTYTPGMYIFPPEIQSIMSPMLQRA